MTWGDTACGGCSYMEQPQDSLWGNQHLEAVAAPSPAETLPASSPSPYSSQNLLNPLAQTWELPELPDLHLTSPPSKAWSKASSGTSFPVPQGCVKLSWLLPEDGGSWGCSRAKNAAPSTDFIHIPHPP